MNKALVWILAAAVYVVMPYDGDFIPLIGWIDDLLVAAFSIYMALENLKRRAKTGPGASTKTTSSDSINDEDPYVVLGVARGASKDEIKTAYRKRIAEYHPDKVAHLGDELKSLADKKAKQIQKAYEALS